MHQMTGACWLVCYRPLALALLACSLAVFVPSYAYQTATSHACEFRTGPRLLPPSLLPIQHAYVPYTTGEHIGSHLAAGRAEL